MAQINGTSLLVKVDGTAVACSTSCTLNINKDLLDSTCKDGDTWKTQIEGKRTWDVSVDGLYQLDDSTHFMDLSSLITTSGVNTFTLIFGTDTDYWTGTAICNTCSLSGDDNALATFSAAFAGTGALVPTEA